MDTSNEKICNSLQGISNVILGFVVIQSITLSYHLESLANKLRSIPFYEAYIVVGQTIIVIGSIIAMIYYSKKVNLLMDAETNKILNPKLTLFVKIGLILYFGIIPIMIIVGPHLGNTIPAGK
jgi:hypothetical protein